MYEELRRQRCPVLGDHKMELGHRDRHCAAVANRVENMGLVPCRLVFYTPSHLDSEMMCAKPDEKFVL